MYVMGRLKELAVGYECLLRAAEESQPEGVTPPVLCIRPSQVQHAVVQLSRQQLGVRRDASMRCCC
eukprot:4102795-Amphidinium_carterae.2